MFVATIGALTNHAAAGEGDKFQHAHTQVRLLTIAGAVVLASRGTAMLSRHSAAFVYVLAYATWTGANLWTTFIGGAHGAHVNSCAA